MKIVIWLIGIILGGLSLLFGIKPTPVSKELQNSAKKLSTQAKKTRLSNWMDKK